jgi:hypothetical protein
MVEPQIPETLEFRVVLLDSASAALLVLDTADGYRLPRVQVRRWLRTAQQLQKGIEAAWGVRVVILNIVMAYDRPGSWVIAEALTPVTSLEFKAVPAHQLPPFELSEREYAALALLLNGKTKDPFSHVGWIDDAVRWVESETGRELTSRNEIEQYNAGGGFVLVRFPISGGRACWLKATGEPNRHEPRITKLLSERGAGYIPDVVAFRPEWYAILISEEGVGIGEIPQHPGQALELLEDAVASMAKLQIGTMECGAELLEAGAFDQRTDVLLEHAPELFKYVEELIRVMPQVGSLHLERERVREIRSAFEGICERSLHLGIPETIVHGDMNPGNIVIGSGHCQFIDWSEAYVANCLVGLQHLLLLNREEDPFVRDSMNAVLKSRYRDEWRAVYESDLFREGLVYMPLLAAVSELYGRGDWLTSPQRDDPSWRSCARRLAGHMDRALRALELQEVL